MAIIPLFIIKSLEERLRITRYLRYNNPCLYMLQRE